MYEHFETSIPDEQSDIQEQYARLLTAEGFAGLTERQQRIIRNSLYVQKRAERLSSEESRQAVVSEKQGYFMDGSSTKVLEEDHLNLMHEQDPSYYIDPATRPYRTSQNYVANWYCHPSILALETETVNGVEPSNLPEDFFEAEYALGENVEDLEKRISRIGVPCIVHISEIPENTDEGFHTKHSFLVLGRNAQGEMVCWEKEGNGLPFRVTNLQSIFEEYNSRWRRHWGVRRLRTA